MFNTLLVKFLFKNTPSHLWSKCHHIRPFLSASAHSVLEVHSTENLCASESPNGGVEQSNSKRILAKSNEQTVKWEVVSAYDQVISAWDSILWGSFRCRSSFLLAPLGGGGGGGVMTDIWSLNCSRRNSVSTGHTHRVFAKCCNGSIKHMGKFTPSKYSSQRTGTLGHNLPPNHHVMPLLTLTEWST